MNAFPEMCNTQVPLPPSLEQGFEAKISFPQGKPANTADGAREEGDLILPFLGEKQLTAVEEGGFGTRGAVWRGGHHFPERAEPADSYRLNWVQWCVPPPQLSWWLRTPCM